MALEQQCRDAVDLHAAAAAAVLANKAEWERLPQSPPTVTFAQLTDVIPAANRTLYRLSATPRPSGDDAPCEPAEPRLQPALTASRGRVRHLQATHDQLAVLAEATLSEIEDVRATSKYVCDLEAHARAASRLAALGGVIVSSVAVIILSLAWWRIF
jgi:hypothetical protein